MDNYVFIPLGQDCSPAATLRELELRTTAMPFDWVSSSFAAMKACLSDDFLYYHTNLQHIGSRMRDHYGFEFPHDYPFNAQEYSIDSNVEWRTHEYVNSQIVSNWHDYYDTVKEKYDRRVERFRDIKTSSATIIVLTRNPVAVSKQYRELLNTYYRRTVNFVVATTENYEDSTMVTCNPERQGGWNNASIWNEGIQRIMQKTKLST